MIQLVNKTAPYINLWLNAAERDPSADPAFIQMLQDLERTPDLTRTLLLAKEFLANSNLRLLGLTALLLGTFDDAKAQGVLDVVLKHAEPKIRVVGLEAAQLGGTTWGLKRCLSGLADKDQMVRVRAQELCKLWDKERIRVLFDELLQRGDTTSMTEAAEGLSRLADVTFLPLIERAMAQVDLTLKRKLVRGLIRIASPEVLDWTKGLKERCTDADTLKLLVLVITDLTREVARTADAPKPAETGRAKGPAARPAGPAAATAESDLGPLVLKRSPSPVARPAAPSSAAPVPPAPESTALEAPPEETAGEAGPPPPPATDGEEEPILVLGDQASPSPGPAEEIVPAAPPPPETPVESRPAAPSGGVLDELGTPLMVKKAKATPPGRPAATPQEPEPRPPKAAVREPARTVKKPMVILPGLDELLSEAPSGPDETPEPAAPAPREPPVKEPPAVAAPAPAAPAPSPKTEPGTPPGRDPTPEPAREASVAEASQPASTATHRDRICGLLKELVTHGGSDLHVRAGQPPSIRRGGRLVPLTDGPIDRLLAEELLACMASLTTPRQMRRFLDQGDLNLSVGVPGVARFRLNYMMSRSVPAFVARVVPMDVPSLNDLHLPPILGTLAMQPRGLILVTGPSGSGKSTTLAAMIDLINCTRKGHIITLEDPLEFLHRDRECAITQREVGTDSRSFADGIRFARRMDPDVILVGEMRDLDTIRAVVQTSGAGRLVLASLGTSSATKSIDRIIGAFPAEEQSQARSNLASFLVGIVTQLLIDQVEGGRVAVHEILVATPAVRKAIRENQPQAIYSQMESGVSQGMVTLEQSLARCLKAGQISREEASARASDPQVLSGLLMK